LTVLGTRNENGLHCVTVALDSGSRYFRLRKGPVAAPCTSEPPRLELRAVGQSAIELAWPEEASCFQLETANTLSAPSWTTEFTVLDSSVAGGLIRVTVPVSGGSRFFRLRRP
jgi:hypothetical protein